jgi:glycosyltransferase involved in cell wall biosynthesis
LRLCIDAFPLLIRSAGIKNYLYHWITHLQDAGLSRIRLFPYLGVPGQLDHERSVVGPFGTLARLALWHGLNLWPNHLLDLLSPGNDIFHAVKLLNPPRRSRLTATLHDLTCWLMPELHTSANVASEKRFADNIWKRADGLIAVSENTRNDAVRLLGLDPQRIQVIYHGIDDRYFEADTSEVERACRQYRLAQPYVLFVGTIEPRKNLCTLLDAYETLTPELRREFQLIIAGPAGWSAEDAKRRLAQPSAGVRYLQYIPERDLPGLFAGATVFAYISLYEGFGFPVAQALAAGVPVLTSAVSALPEITGGSAELVDPHSVNAVRAALERLLTSPARRCTLTAAGRQRAQRFRWKICAAESLRFFENIAGRL